MFELLEKFSPAQLIGLVATVGGLLGWIITTVAMQWRRVRVAEIEASLKQQMLERGMGAGDIEQVMRASKKGSPAPEQGFDGTPASAKSCLVKTLADAGYEGEDIERVLRAFGQHPDGAAVTEKEGRERVEAMTRAIAAKLCIVEKMARNGHEAEDIERVLKTFTDDAPWRLDRQPEPVRA